MPLSWYAFLRHLSAFLRHHYETRIASYPRLLGRSHLSGEESVFTAYRQSNANFRLLFRGMAIDAPDAPAFVFQLDP
jgi:hypothetical protein